MRCRICSEDKLSKEFIPYSMTSSCKHPRLMCLRCATKAAKESSKCPYKDCGQPVSVDSNEIHEFNAILNCMFSEVHPTSDDLPPPVNESGVSSTINIVMLTGERHVFPFNPSDTVLRLKRNICTELDIKVQNQKLLYEEHELKDRLGLREARMSDFNVKPNSSIFLLIVLYNLPSDLKRVTFDLSWNYPHTGRDYLDATCLVFNNTLFVKRVDYISSFMAPESAVTYLGPGSARGNSCRYVDLDWSKVSIHHEGDVMNDFTRLGKHTIDVHVDRLPSNVTHLFFTLSAWEHPTISHFPNPTLKFYEKSKPGVNLCETTFTHARHSSAVIMCSLSRVDGGWRVIRSGALSAGNAKNYEPLKDKIRQMIREGKC